MPFPRPIDSTLHGVTDYSVGTALLTVFPRLANLERTDSARQIRLAGGIHVGYSTLTDYPLGIVKALPFQAHLALDAVGAVTLAATPFATSQWKKGRRHWVPHVALAVFELMSLALTDPTGAGDFHGDLDAVRAANMEDPHRKIYEGAPAVRPAAVAVASGAV
ncbi:MAG TPA: hypothetical protein VG325_16415 [Solirubrobacteraceae bacterium]|jgi:hypothetical protein|nr:hypothetical protein [Solirubrobacteraceae bacterium]